MTAHYEDEEDLLSWCRVHDLMDVYSIFEAKGIRSLDSLSDVDIEELSNEVHEEKRREVIKKALKEYQNEHGTTLKSSETEEEEEKQKQKQKKIIGIFSTLSKKV
jgi:hypothetical protein